MIDSKATVIACTCFLCSTEPALAYSCLILVSMVCIVVLVNTIGNCYRRETRIKRIMNGRHRAHTP